jgi:hypothetical protein
MQGRPQQTKLVLEKMYEFAMGRGNVPTISYGIAMFEPDMPQTMIPDHLETRWELSTDGDRKALRR